MSGRRIDRLLSPPARPRNRLQRLLGTAEHLAHLTDEVRALLPAPLARHCFVAALKGTRLTLHADNASFATRLRFAAPALLKRLRTLADFSGITDIAVSTARRAPPAPARRQAVALRARPPARLLDDLADGISDESLKASVRRLRDSAGRRDR